MDDATTIDPPPKHRRRWYQYSLRSLLLLMLVVGLASGWLGIRMRQAQHEQDAAETIRKAGGNVYFDATVADGCQLVKAPEPTGFRAWLAELLRVDIFATANYVDLSNRGVDDALLAALDELPQVQHLILYDTKLTAAQLERLAQTHPLLATLDLRMTDVTTLGLRHLGGLGRLQSLNLSGLQITDAGLSFLQGLSQLRELYLTETPIGDAALEHLRGLTQVRRLYLNDTQVGSLGLNRLKEMKQLQHLALYRTNVGDEGLDVVRGNSRLEYLDLSYTRVSDTRLPCLAGLSKLQWLYLRGSNVTTAGIQSLKLALPKCTIDGP